MKNKKLTIALFDSYLSIIKNSVGTKSFRNLYAYRGGQKIDITDNGKLSCAFFVSSILVIFGLIPKIHATVRGTIADLKKSGWKKIKHPKIGSILIWEKKVFGKTPHKHIGFYVSRHRAISNNYKTKSPILHHWAFGRNKSSTYRKIEAIYWRPKLHK